MKILITGGLGYIGQHLIKMLKPMNHDIDIIDLKNRDNPIDIRLPPIIRKEYHTVIHLAALVKVNESVQWPEEYYKTNIFGTLNILNQISFQNFIFASTGTAKDTNSPYAVSKRAAEDLVISLCKRYNKDYTVFRFYNVLGSDGFLPTNSDGLFYNLIEASKTGLFNLYGTDYNTKDGTCVRDFVHVNEVCTAICDAITQPANSLENLGHGIGYTVKEIIEIYKKVNNAEFSVKHMPKRQGDLEVSVLDYPSSYMKNLYSIEQLLKNP